MLWIILLAITVFLWFYVFISGKDNCLCELADWFVLFIVGVICFLFAIAVMVGVPVIIFLTIVRLW